MNFYWWRYGVAYAVAVDGLFVSIGHVVVTAQSAPEARDLAVSNVTAQWAARHGTIIENGISRKFRVVTLPAHKLAA